MDRVKLLVIILTFCSIRLSAQPDSSVFFVKVNDFLLQNVNEGKVNYRALKDSSAQLNEIVSMIETMNLTGRSDNYKIAFYINAYNILVIQQVMDYYPVVSPMDVSGFFNRRKFIVCGEQITLDQIEFNKLFEPYQDCRIHFALVCAAKSCPYLHDNAYTPEHIQEELTFRAQLIIDRPNYVSVNKRKKEVYVSKVFDWYKEQFLSESSSIIDYINKYRFYKVPDNYSVVFYEYDWSLNDQSKLE